LLTAPPLHPPPLHGTGLPIQHQLRKCSWQVNPRPPCLWTQCKSTTGAGFLLPKIPLKLCPCLLVEVVSQQRLPPLGPAPHLLASCTLPPHVSVPDRPTAPTPTASTATGTSPPPPNHPPWLGHQGHIMYEHTHTYLRTWLEHNPSTQPETARSQQGWGITRLSGALPAFQLCTTQSRSRLASTCPPPHPTPRVCPGGPHRTNQGNLTCSSAARPRCMSVCWSAHRC
jgi:hypothetical protein